MSVASKPDYSQLSMDHHAYDSYDHELSDIRTLRRELFMIGTCH